MKFLYTVKDKNGKILKEGSAYDIQDYLCLSRSNLEGAIMVWELGVTVERAPYHKPVSELKKKEEKKETLEEMVKRHILIYDNVAIGKESADRVQGLISHLAKEGIVLEAYMQNGGSGWIIQRKKSKK